MIFPFSVVLAAIVVSPPAIPAVSLGRVQTLVYTAAGDGVAGMENGPGKAARFLEPFAVAFDKLGKLYIVDRAAQRIRVLYRGQVSTLAGSGSLDMSGQHVTGGYHDGPAQSAAFNEPTGVAVGPDGSIFVADSENHCIRKISNGTVTTFSGSPDRKTAVDGSSSVAGFEDPRALSFDSDGNLYVADYRTAIRRIDKDGSVSSLPIAPGPKEFTGVSASGSGESLRVAATDNVYLYIYSDLNKVPEMVGSTEGGRSVGAPYSVVALNEYEYIVADLTNSVVRMLRAPLKPFVSNWYQTELAGQARESDTVAAGFADGSTSVAQLDDPAGIAVSSSGLVAIADAGNRRIRFAALPDMRMPVGNRVNVFADFPNDYKICYVASSQAHYLHWWQDSTAGQIESGLRQNWKALGLPKKPTLFSARIDGGNDAKQSLWDWAEQIPGEGLADMVVLSLFSGDRPTENDDFTKRIVALRDSLRKNGVKLFVAVYPAGVEISPNEAIRRRDTVLTDDDMRFNDFIVNRDRTEKALRDAKVPFYSAYNDFIRYEQGARIAPLYGVIDSHFTEYGSAFYGQLIEKAMEDQKPWLP